MWFRRIRVVGVLSCWIAFVGGSQAANAQLANQPANKHSTLVDKDNKNIRDSEFAQLIKDLLVPAGTNDVRDAKFIFQQCYGGGMLDDLKTALGNKVKWVGGSASKHDEVSIGQVSTAENQTEGHAAKWVADPPEDWWTKVLKGELVKDQTLEKGIKFANDNDGANNNGSGKLETGQSVTANGGDTIKLKDAGATSHHAILWAGNADHMRHFNDIKNVRDALINQWGQPGANVSITVLFRDGLTSSDGTNLPDSWNAQAATKQKLQDTINALKPTIDTNEQFFFYASDHGDVETDVVEQPRNVPANGGRDDSVFSLSCGELEGMRRQNDNQPTVVVEHNVCESLTVAVSLNGESLGNLDPPQGPCRTTSVQVFIVPESLLEGDRNVLTFQNDGTLDVDIFRATFALGSIDSNPFRDDSDIACASIPIPTVSVWGLIVLALLILVSGTIMNRKIVRAAV